jgi:hypothetical protein
MFEYFAFSSLTKSQAFQLHCSHNVVEDLEYPQITCINNKFFLGFYMLYFGVKVSSYESSLCVLSCIYDLYS